VGVYAFFREKVALEEEAVSLGGPGPVFNLKPESTYLLDGLTNQVFNLHPPIFTLLS